MTNVTNHEWPKSPREHVWSKWLSKNRTTQYRVCVHPRCTAVDERPVAQA